MQTFISNLSNQHFPVSEKVKGDSIGSSLLKFIQDDCPQFDATGLIAISELNRYRHRFIEYSLEKELGEIRTLEKSVLDTLQNDQTLADKINLETASHQLSYGQKLADNIAAFGGSWTFIISFFCFILFWIAANVFWMMNQGFDPYPFILLNLILSCLAALQAPVIMMSQNRQEEKDRERSKDDYMINLKSELEIRMLHEKIDHLMLRQQQEMFEIQQIQIEMMSEIIEKVTARS